MPARIIRFSAQGVWKTACMAAGTASELSDSAAGSSISAVPRIMSPYQNTASTTEIISTRPISLNGRSISSAAWGMTSKPTNMNGTMMITVMMPPITPPSTLNSGSMVVVLPSNSDPVMNITPTARISRVTTFCTSAAVRTPR